MRRTTAPPEIFSHSPPISRRTRCHDDPSGARVAILITVGPAYAAARKETRNSRTAAPAALLQEEIIRPPFEPSRLALRQEIGEPVFRGLPPRVKGERPGKKPQELLPVLRSHGNRLGECHQGGDPLPAAEFHRALEVPFRPGQGPPHRLGAPPFERDEVFVNRPVIVILLQRKGAAHERFAPGKVREQGRIGPREGDRKAPGGGGPEKQGDVLPAGDRGRALRVRFQPFSETGVRGLETSHAILLRPQEEALRPFPACVPPLPVRLFQRVLQDERRSVLGEPPGDGKEQPPVGRLLRENVFLRLERERNGLPHKLRVVVGAEDLPFGRHDIRHPRYDVGPGGTPRARYAEKQGEQRRERAKPIFRWMPPPGPRFPAPRSLSGPVPGAGTASGETPKTPKPRFPRSSPGRRIRWPERLVRRGRSVASRRTPVPPSSAASSCRAGRGRSGRSAPGRGRPPPSRRGPPELGIRTTPAWPGPSLSHPPRRRRPGWSPSRTRETSPSSPPRGPPRPPRGTRERTSSPCLPPRSP